MFPQELGCFTHMSAQVLGCPFVSIVTFWEVAELDFRPIPKSLPHSFIISGVEGGARGGSDSIKTSSKGMKNLATCLRRNKAHLK